jgi:hypothetical protein
MRLPLLAFLASFSLIATAPAARADLLIAVDKDAQRMSVVVDGAQRYDWPVSTGVAGHDTPNGSYRPFRMEKSHFSREWDNAPMPHAIFFSQIGHAIHGTTYTRHLGRPASHGCVRLAPRNAATLFALVKEQKMANTRVTIEGSIGEAVASVNRPGSSRRSANRSYDEDEGVVQARYTGQPRRTVSDPFAAQDSSGADNRGGNFGYRSGWR